jgi:hypothetical protein
MGLAGATPSASCANRSLRWGVPQPYTYAKFMMS